MANTGIRFIQWFPWLKKGTQPLPPGTYEVTIEDAIELTHTDGSKVVILELKQVHPTKPKNKLGSTPK